MKGPTRHLVPKEKWIPWDRFGSRHCPQMKRIRSDWDALLQRDKLPERYYHDFIARHAHVFFPMFRDSVQVINKIRLGAELVTDLVTVRDEASHGLSYCLIEIEPPWAAPFTKDGISSARLNRAIQQVLDWKRWLDDHQTEARRLFPSFLHFGGIRTLFKFCIIIGTRKNSRQWLEKRNHLSEALGISIRSFDCLTDGLRALRAGRIFVDEYMGGGVEEDRLPPEVKNALANPFVRAMTDPDWRKFVSGRFDHCHMVGHNAESLLAIRRTNSHEAPFLKRVGKTKASFRNDAK